MIPNIRVPAIGSACLLIALLVPQAVASPLATELSWPDLVPDQPVFDDPFASLTSDQLYDLSIVARARERKDAGREMVAGDRREQSEAVSRLAAQGIDVDALLARRQEITEKRRAAAEATVPALDGKRIRMPGYLLPLEFSDTATTEFLLVPFVGACIHVPPPPPNQIVQVRYAPGYQSEGLFTPVWVEGEMQVGSGRQELYLMDGAADIDVGYSITAITVEEYRAD